MFPLISSTTSRHGGGLLQCSNAGIDTGWSAATWWSNKQLPRSGGADRHDCILCRDRRFCRISCGCPAKILSSRRFFAVLSPPVQKSFEGNHRRLLVCDMRWARSCVPILIVAEETDCAGMQILSHPERREVSGVS